MRIGDKKNELNKHSASRNCRSRSFTPAGAGQLSGGIHRKPSCPEKREKGNVTIFAFDEGQGLSEHTAPFDALVQAVEGEAEITVAGKPIGVKAGEVVLLPAEKPHAVKATTRFKMVLTMIRS